MVEQPAFANFNPRSPHGERLRGTAWLGSLMVISIHAPRMGSDMRIGLHLSNISIISIHAPRMGSDKRPLLWPLGILHFNPRSPHGERPFHRSKRHSATKKFQSTLPAWGATVSRADDKGRKNISIHAPRMGSDNEIVIRGRIIMISIHAPRMGSDNEYIAAFQRENDFNPRSPHGERPVAVTKIDDFE